jgi:endonuclease/exonuclease/phosphatase family metal-dependent hydrolase
VSRPGGVRVATLNLASGRDRRGRPLDAAALARAAAPLADADVVSLQEVDTAQPRSLGVDQPAVLAGALDAVAWRSAPTVSGTPGPAEGWRPVEPVALRGPGAPASGPLFGVAVLSRLPVHRWHVLGLGTGRAKLPVPDRATGRLVWIPDEPRVAVAAELDGLTVVGTHLSFAPHTATGQLRRLAEWAAGLPAPVVVAGDLNLGGSLPSLLTGGSRLVRGRTFPAADPRVQFDHVLALGGATGVDPRIRRLDVGDHRAAEVTVRAGAR